MLKANKQEYAWQRTRLVQLQLPQFCRPRHARALQQLLPGRIPRRDDVGLSNELHQHVHLQAATTQHAQKQAGLEWGRSRPLHAKPTGMRLSGHD